IGLSRRPHGLENDVQSYALQNGVHRVIGYLLHEQRAQCGSGREPVTVASPVIKATIASRLSPTPDCFARLLPYLHAAGLIEIDNRDIRIVDVERLVRYPVN